MGSHVDGGVAPTLQAAATAVAALFSVLPICDRQRIVYAAAAIPNSLNKACMPTRSCS